MVRYKGTYCPARQYMPKKPEKWGIKVWCLADSITCYIANFDIYCGKSNSILECPQPSRVEASLGHSVVMDLTRGLEEKNHVVTMDNYFTSVGLFRDLECRGIYATGMVRSNRIGLPPDLTNTKEFKKHAQGELDWAMHESRKMCAVIWKDKQPVLLLSRHAPPITAGAPMDCTVPRHNGATRPEIPTSPVLKEYTKNMHGVDVADHLRGNYSSLTRTHKWWHRVFHFLLDMSTVNMYIMYLEILQKLGKSHEAITHLQFRHGLCQALTWRWKGTNPIGVSLLPWYPKMRCPWHTLLRRECEVCGIRCQHFCYKCGWKWFCVDKGCYELAHTPRRFRN
jgi:hypothetical protein